MSLTLLDKIDIVLKKYNNGEDNDYSLNMKTLISRGFEVCINDTCIEDFHEYPTIKELIGICILDNNPDLFE